MNSNPIAIYYRGTDKYLEINPVPPTEVFEFADQIRSQHPSKAILIQTDQKQVRDLACNYFQGKCSYIEDLPVTSGSIALHHIKNKSLSKVYSGQQLVAMAESISYCSTLITVASNVGFFLALKLFNRGGNIYQVNGSYSEIQNFPSSYQIARSILSVPFNQIHLLNGTTCHKIILLLFISN